jgi:hypothetical protein
MDRKEAKLQYKLSHRPMGVYQVRNTVNDKVWINSSLNLPGSFNGDRVKLNGGMHHKSPKLMKAWKEFGEESFVWEILEEVFPRSEPGYDYKADLEFLEDLWLEKLEPYGENGYNEPKKTREERLRMIAQNRKNEL